MSDFCIMSHKLDNLGDPKDQELHDAKQWSQSRTAESRAARQEIMERLFLSLSPLETLQLRDSMLARLERYKCSTP